MRISRYAFVVLLLGVLSFVSCVRKVSQDEEKLGVEVLLKLTDPEEVRNGTRSGGEAEDPEDYGFYVEEGDCWFGVSTRAISAVSTLANSNVVWGAYTPSGVWSPSRVTTNNSGVVSTGHYCASSGTTNNTYYVTNVSNASNLSINSTAGTITVSQSANSGTDIVAGWASSTSSNVSVTVKHVYARTGSLSFSAPSGASVSNVTWSLKSHDNTTGTSGTYNIRNDTWSSSGQLSATSINSSSDLYLIPGQYDVTVSFRLTQGSVTRNLSRTGTVTLERGKINNISAGINNRHELILSPASATINRGATQAYSVTLRTYYVMGSTDVDYIDTSVSNSSCTWSSSNTSVATVSNGTATGVSSGSSTITARYTPSGSSQISAVAVLVVRSSDNIDPGWDPGSGINL